MKVSMISDISDCAVLNNQVRMPWLGLGVWQSKEGPEVERAVADALDLGYRHIDTAMVYGNETGVGNVIRKTQIPREDIFVTTKVWNSDQGYKSTLAAFRESCRRLGMNQVDLYLIHWPVAGKYVDTWKALEELYHEGKCRAIGLSNFMVMHLEVLLPQAEVLPMVNQIEFHPYLVQPDLLRFCQESQIQIEAWSPLMQGRIGEVDLLREIGKRHRKTPAQVALRWDLQHGIVTIPKTVRKERMAENSDLYDFQLSDEEMNRIDQLDRGQRFGPDPYTFAF